MLLCSSLWTEGQPRSLPSGFGESGQAWPPCPIIPWLCILATALLLETTSLGSHGNAGLLTSIFRNTREN